MVILLWYLQHIVIYIRISLRPETYSSRSTQEYRANLLMSLYYLKYGVRVVLILEDPLGLRVVTTYTSKYIKCTRLTQK